MIAACCLVYGLYRAIFPRVTDEEAAEIAEEHWKQYARVTGIALLLRAFKRDRAANAGKASGSVDREKTIF